MSHRKETPVTQPGEVGGWDFANDPLNPRPTTYPECPDCGEAYHYQRFISLTKGGHVWAWGKPPKVTGGCRHNPPPRMTTPP